MFFLTAKFGQETILGDRVVQRFTPDTSILTTGMIFLIVLYTGTLTCMEKERRLVVVAPYSVDLSRTKLRHTHLHVNRVRNGDRLRYWYDLRDVYDLRHRNVLRNVHGLVDDLYHRWLPAVARSQTADGQ